jgi:hypothetical protein
MKRFVAFFFMLGSRVDSKKRNGTGPVPATQVQGREADSPLCAAGLIGTPQA